ncbi:MAG: hypothetical protein RMK29_13235 [Myxococcales bacterium]|nr:hypothetical protein [Myxococcota bacterium]MDW8282670.1 hypothetical protein [Myxococcales bacterium]
MIPAAPLGWVVLPGQHCVLYHPPEGRGAGEVRYHERLYPARRPRDLFLEATRLDPSLRPLSPPEALVTEEGEFAFLLSLAGDGPIWRRHLGTVFCDEFSTLLDVIVRDPLRADEMERLCRRLLLGTSLGLGLRRRRYRYLPPAGWQGLPMGLTTTWYPPEYPRDLTHLCVYPASPVPDPPEAAFQAALEEEQGRGLRVQGCRGPEPFLSSTGLRGHLWHVDGRHRHGKRFFRKMCIYRQGPYLYTLRLDTLSAERLAEHEAVFVAVARSVSALPTPPAAALGTERSAVALWAD